MNKISKLALALFAITAVTNVSFGMNPQKEISIEQILLQKKIKQLNEEKEKASEFNKIYLPYKLFGDEPHFSDIIITGVFGQITSGLFFTLLTRWIPHTPENATKIQTSTFIANGLTQIVIGTAVQKHKTRITVRNEQIKNLEKILAEMEK